MFQWGTILFPSLSVSYGESHVTPTCFQKAEARTDMSGPLQVIYACWRKAWIKLLWTRGRFLTAVGNNVRPWFMFVYYASPPGQIIDNWFSWDGRRERENNTKTVVRTADFVGNAFRVTTSWRALWRPKECAKMHFHWKVKVGLMFSEEAMSEYVTCTNLYYQK